LEASRRGQTVVYGPLKREIRRGVGQTRGKMDIEIGKNKMDLPDNIIRHFLRNVYFIAGCACGGKSTIAKYLSEKHEVDLYNWDERNPQHKEISDPSYQPYMNKEFPSWEEYFGRPPREYAESLRKSILEQVEIAIIELICLSKDRTIIVDGVFPLSVLKSISSKDRVVFLMAEMNAIRKDYLNRADKQDMLECLNSLRDPQKATENMFLSIEYFLARDLQEIKESGFKWFNRGEYPNWKEIREEIERHFNLGAAIQREL
jgi:hypothetical protein